MTAYDVAVVGGGLAGWMAAGAASEAGARTLVIERSARPEGDGNSVISGGALHASLRDPRSPPQALMEAITRSTGGESAPEVVSAWAKHAARTIEWIERHGGCLMTNDLYPHRAKVFSPVKPTRPGLSGAPYGTADFLRASASKLRARGGHVIQPARATTLTRIDRYLWQLALEDGATIDARAVILADGGFQADRGLVAQHIGTDRLKLRAADTSVGDGLRMGLANGGVATHMRGFYGHLLHRQAMARDDLWPYPILDLVAAVGIIVGPDGRRIVDEGIGGVRSTNAVAWSASPDACWLIVDDAGWSAEGRVGETPPNPYLADQGVGPVSAPTLELLARRIDVDATGLAERAATVRPGRTGQLKLSQPPFHAIPLIAGISFTFGGLRIDANARLLDANDAPILGLYAAGGTAAGLHGGPDVGYAGGLLEAAVFGLLAGEDAAAQMVSGYAA